MSSQGAALTLRMLTQEAQNICITNFVQCWTNVEDFGPALCKCYTNVLCLLENTLSPMLLNDFVSKTYLFTATNNFYIFCLLHIQTNSEFPLYLEIRENVENEFPFSSQGKVREFEKYVISWIFCH